MKAWFLGFCAALFLGFGVAASASEHGLAYGVTHTSNPVLGRPFNDKQDPLQFTLLGAGGYWSFGKHERNEFVMLYGIQHDITILGDGYQWGASFMLIHKHPHRKHK